MFKIANKRIVVVLVAILLCFVVGIAIFAIVNHNKKTENSDTNINGAINSTIDEIEPNDFIDNVVTPDNTSSNITVSEVHWSNLDDPNNDVTEIGIPTESGKDNDSNTNTGSNTNQGSNNSDSSNTNQGSNNNDSSNANNSSTTDNNSYSDKSQMAGMQPWH